MSDIDSKATITIDKLDYDYLVEMKNCVMQKDCIKIETICTNNNYISHKVYSIPPVNEQLKEANTELAKAYKKLKNRTLIQRILNR